MMYQSCDGRMFESEQKRCEYEQRCEANRRRAEDYNIARLSRLDEISCEYSKLQNLIFKFKRDFGRDFNGYFVPRDLMRMLRE